MKKTMIASFVLLVVSVGASAQTFKEFFNGDKFNHLDFSVTAGTTGLGFDLAMPLGDKVQIRAGATFMPHFEKEMHFSAEVGEGTQAEKDARFTKLQDMMRGFTGLEVNNSVEMIGEPNMNNFKFLVDVFPFKNKHWHVTAGFYVGGTNVGKAQNSASAMSSLLATSIYNRMYKNAAGYEPLMSYNGTSVTVDDVSAKIFGYGMMSVPLGELTTTIIAEEDIYYDYTKYKAAINDTSNPDWFVLDEDNGNPHEKGKIHYRKGDVIYKSGETFRIMPDEENMIRATAKVKSFKPYLGFGYSADISNCTKISFDAGLMFWGKPSVIARTPVGVNAKGETVYASVDMCSDLTNIRGKANDYVKLFNKFWAYPVIGLRITQRIF